MARTGLGRILVVDDDPRICRLVRSFLAQKGYEVADASSGEDALKRIRSEKYDLVLLDNWLPGITGIEACREIRAGSDIAIVVMSAGYEVRAHALQAGASDYLRKPFGVSELFACVELNIREREPGEE
jgi:DNA-binding response OmpR family regulator